MKKIQQTIFPSSLNDPLSSLFTEEPWNSIMNLIEMDNLNI